MNPGGFTRIRCDVPRPHVARITLASGPANALDAQTLGELFAALTFARTTAEVRAVVLTGAGPHFCSGGEVPSVPAPDGRMVGPLAEVLRAIHELGKPSLAAIDGRVQGAGLALALATDLAIAAEGATFQIPEPRAGLWSFLVLAELVPLVGRRRAAELFLDGHELGAVRAQSLGLVNHVALGPALDDALTRAGKLAAMNPTAMAMGLPALRRASASDPALLDWLQGQLDGFLASPDAREAVAAFRDGRDPAWKT